MIGCALAGLACFAGTAWMVQQVWAQPWAVLAQIALTLLIVTFGITVGGGLLMTAWDG